ncbi:MAG TPA: hypothetical protein PKD85_02755 [Saprospiraceae bacterium]|nr:hypothetical protein [Saprospiraceae bacterium]
MRSYGKIRQFVKVLCANKTNRIEYYYEYREEGIKNIIVKGESSSLTFKLYYLSVVEEYMEVLKDNTLRINV